MDSTRAALVGHARMRSRVRASGRGLDVSLRRLLLMVALSMGSVPLLHLYLRVELSPWELAVHSVDIGLGVALVGLLLQIVSSIVRPWLRGTRVEVAPWLVGVGLSVVGGLLLYWFRPPALLPSADAVLERHVAAGYPDMGLRVVPWAAVIGYLAWTAGGASRRRSARERTLDATETLADLEVQTRVLEELRPCSSGTRAGAAPSPDAEESARAIAVVDRMEERAPVAAGRDAAVVLEHDGQLTRVRPREILRVQAMDNYCEFSCLSADDTQVDARLLVRTTLSEARALLPAEAFVQSHRSHLVQVACIRAVERRGRNAHLVLEAGETVPLARNRRREVLAQLRHA